MLRRDRLHRSGLLMRSQSWFCLRFLEKCEELSWERGQGSVERDHSGNRWDNGLQGPQAEQGTRPSPASGQQVGDPRDSKWGSLHQGLISVPEAGRAHPRQELAAPPSLNSTSNLTWPQLNLLVPERGAVRVSGPDSSPRPRRSHTCPAGLCPAAAAQVSDWPLLGPRRLPDRSWLQAAAAQQRLLTAHARAAAPEDAVDASVREPLAQLPLRTQRPRGDPGEQCSQRQ